MNTFKEILDIVGNEEGMRKAVENLEKDCKISSRHQGNIPVGIRESIGVECKKLPKDSSDTSLFKGIIRNHRSIVKQGDFPKKSPPTGRPLLRVISLDDFIRHHFLNSSTKEIHNPFGQGAAGRSKETLLKKKVIKDLKSGETDWDTDSLSGSTGKIGEPSWWTFRETGNDDPQTGEQYMKELALSEKSRNSAQEDNMVIEISLDENSLRQNLFKPTALDDFRSGTLFEPELTGKPYGYTKPTEDGLQSRPELVSPSVAYGTINPDTKK